MHPSATLPPLPNASRFRRRRLAIARLVALFALAAPLLAQDAPPAFQAYLDAVRYKLDLEAITDADVEAASKATAAYAATGDQKALEVLTGDANKLGRRVLDGSVELEEKRLEGERLHAKLEEATGDARADLEAKLTDLDARTKSLDALLPGLRRMRDVLYEGILDLVGVMAEKTPEQAYDVLVAHFRDDVKVFHDLEEEVRQLESHIANRREKLASLKDEPLARAEMDVRRAAATLDVKRADLERLRSLRERRIASIGDVWPRLPAKRQSGELAEVRRNFGPKASWEERALYAEILGRLPVDGVPEDLVAAMKRSAKDRAALGKDLEPLREAYRKAVDAVTTSLLGGSVYQEVVDNEERCRNALQEASRRAFGETVVLEACGRALGHALLRLDDAAKGEAVADLLKTTERERDPALRSRWIGALAAVDTPAVREALLAVARKDSDVEARIAAIDGLARLQDDAAVELCITQLLVDPDWRVRAAAIHLLRDVPRKTAVPALISAVGQEVGRLVDDADAALAVLTGRSFHGDGRMWKDWWAANKDTFQIGATPAPQTAQGEEPAPQIDERGGGVSFYGIMTRSNRILFVFDRSGSMEARLDDAVTGAGSTRKIDAARQQLKSAIAGLEEGDTFNIITYAGDVTRWQKRMAVMSKGARDKAERYIDHEIAPLGGTNIHDALQEAFRLAGIGAVDKAYEAGVDTIFFLTDGRASQGESQDSEEILARVREWNRLSRIVVHTVGVGKDQDAAFLRRLAEENGGQYVGR